MKKGGFLFFLLFTAFSIYSQGKYRILNPKGVYKLKYELVNDLIILPVQVNGAELSFLLDTGINTTLIFSLDETDSIEVKNSTAIRLRGLGAGEPIAALKSLNNTIRIGEIESRNETIFIITEEVVGLSNRLGVEVNGIIGYDFFKDLIFEFNYPKSFVKVYDPKKYKYRPCSKCSDVPLTFFGNKPYVKALVDIDGAKKIEMTLLLDTGSGDAVWIFENESKGIKVPERFFEDFLGFGISGSVYGDRTRIKSLSLGDHKIEAVTASFPDSLYVKGVEEYSDRNGSIGAQIFKRFHTVLDYGNKNLRLSPNSQFDDPFEYNMSGVVVEHFGYQLVKDLLYGAKPQFEVEGNNSQGITVYKSTYKLNFTLQPQYRIAEIRPDSPAAAKGLQKGDVLVSINGKLAHKFSLGEISEILSSKEGRRIRMEIQRNGVIKKFVFKLVKIL